jgi:hypothetical protein
LRRKPSCPRTPGPRSLGANLGTALNPLLEGGVGGDPSAKRLLLRGALDCLNRGDRKRVTETARMDSVLDRLDTAIKEYLASLDTAVNCWRAG